MIARTEEGARGRASEQDRDGPDALASRETVARHAATTWAQIAAPLPAGAISWRQDGRPTQREGRWYARFVCYVEAGTVRERLDAVVPGEWDLSLDPLPVLAYDEDDAQRCSFKARLHVLGVIREDVGSGRDYKQAATDAFKRAAVRFGVGHELYGMHQLWVQVDGDGRFAKPLEDPATVYARKYGAGGTIGDPGGRTAAAPAPREPEAAAPVEPATAPPAASAPPTRPADRSDPEQPGCPKCGGRVWDNRQTKRNPRAPDYKCRDRQCDGVIWPPRDGNGRAGAAPVASDEPQEYTFDSSPLGGDDDIPF